MVGDKIIIGLLVLKERLQPFNFHSQPDIRLEVLKQIIKCDLVILLGIQGCTGCSKKVGVGRVDDMIIIQLQCPDKCILQFREKM